MIKSRQEYLSQLFNSYLRLSVQLENNIDSEFDVNNFVFLKTNIKKQRPTVKKNIKSSVIKNEVHKEDFVYQKALTFNNLRSEIEECTKCSSSVKKNSSIEILNTRPYILVITDNKITNNEKDYVKTVLKNISLTSEGKEFCFANLIRCDLDSIDKKNVSNCSSYLVSQIALLSPLCIMSFGKHLFDFFVSINSNTLYNGIILLKTKKNILEFKEDQLEKKYMWNELKKFSNLLSYMKSSAIR